MNKQIYGLSVEIHILLKQKQRFDKCANKYTDSYPDKSVSVSFSLVKLMAT